MCNLVADVFDYIKTFEIPLELLKELRDDLVKQEVNLQRHTWSSQDKPGSYSIITGDISEHSFYCLAPQELSVKVSSYCVSLIHEVYSNLSLHFSTTLRYNVYPESTGMGDHWDSIYEIFDGNLKGVPVISTVGLLNKPKEGGELIFTEPGGESRTVLTEEGTFVMFPSTFIYSHKVSPVVSGRRDSFVFWSF